MVKQVKQSLELTDNFITERIEGGYPRQQLTSGYDLRDFVDDSQSRFTDDLEELIDEITEKVDQNSKDIKDNEVANQDDHDDFRSRFTKNNIDILDNRTELNVNRSRLDKLAKDNRVIGYYVNASQDLTVDVNEDTLVESFLPPTGSYAIIDNDYEVIDNNPEDAAFIVFNATDLLGDRRSFLGIFSGDIIELSFVRPSANTTIDSELITDYYGRITFRVKLEYNAASQLGSDIIKVDVAFVNTSFDVIPVFDSVPETLPLEHYSKVSVTPALVVDNLVDPKTLREAVLPIGSIVPWASTKTIPNGWLICDGRKLDQIKPQLNFGQSKALEELFNKFNFSTLPPLAGRYVAGIKGNYTNNHVHQFTVLGKLYDAKTGAPTNNSGNASNLSLPNDGVHSHNASMSNSGKHQHNVGRKGGDKPSSDGNGNTVHDVRGGNSGVYETEEEGPHNHNLNVNNYNTNHNHTVSGFNNETTRPHTVAMHYIIKYQ